MSILKRALRVKRLDWQAMLLVLFVSPSFGALAEGLMPIAVVDFTASKRSPYQQSVPELIVNELVNTGRFDVLEREKLDSLVGEISFQANSGFVSPESAVRVGGLLGAQLIISGHILDFGKNTQRYSGYGINTTKTTYSLKARIEVIDVTSGIKLFSNVASAQRESKTVQGQSYDNTQKDLSQSVAQKLVSAMLDSPRIKRVVDGPESVAVVVTSEPEGADVEVDGIHYGSAGHQLTLTPGLHSFVSSLPGYTPWSKKVMVQSASSDAVSDPVFKLRARLLKEVTARTESEIRVEVVNEE